MVSKCCKVLQYEEADIRNKKKICIVCRTINVKKKTLNSIILVFGYLSKVSYKSTKFLSSNSIILNILLSTLYPNRYWYYMRQLILYCNHV
ncbi:unnamed protein product [Rhizophagus irregularis]|nr:unnamed protein product [Rhizophagus irregularis]